MNDIKNRKGCVVITDQLTHINPDFDVLKALFSVFFPVAILPDHATGFYHDLKYYGYSELFDEISEGQAMPEYEVLMTRNEGGSISVEAKRKQCTNS